MNCPKCNQPLLDGAKFCLQCGTPAPQAGTPTPPVQSAPPSGQPEPAFQPPVPQQAAPQPPQSGKPSRSLPKWVIPVIAVLAVLVIVLVVVNVLKPKDGGDPTTAATAAEQVEGVSSPDTTAGIQNMSDSWDSFQFAAFGDVYQLPMPCQTFLSKGWTLSSDSDLTTVAAKDYENADFLKNNISVRAEVKNYDSSDREYSDCYIASVKYSSTIGDTVNFTLPGGVVVGQSTYDDVVAAFGDKHTAKTDLSTSYYIEYYTLEEDGSRNYSEQMTLHFVSATDTLSTITLSCETVPSDFRPSKADTNPYYDYQKPTVQSTDLNDAVLSYDGVLYKFPCPLSVFIENGWTVDDSASKQLDDEVSAGFSQWIPLQYKTDYSDSQTGGTGTFGWYIGVTVVNTSTSANILRNCVVQDAKFSADRSGSAAQFSKKIGFAFPIATKADVEKANTQKNLNMDFSSETKDGVHYEYFTYKTEDKSLEYKFGYKDGTLYSFRIEVKP